MIHAAGWFAQQCYGAVGLSGKPWDKPSPDLSQTNEVLRVVERPVKYLSRMRMETRASLCAAALAMRAADWRGGEIGLISTDASGVVKANEDYFRDYVTTGRTLGRGNLFIYTLPTSTLGEVAIALSLTGPSMFMEHDLDATAAMIRDAEQMIADGEAKGMLAIIANKYGATCLAIAAGANGLNSAELFQAAIR
jgi:3-oxoacyl-(acyl-carrier-protein) synthase